MSPLDPHQAPLLSVLLAALKKVICPHPIPCPRDLSLDQKLEIAKAREEKREKMREEGKEEKKKRRRRTIAKLETSPTLDGKRRIRKRSS